MSATYPQTCMAKCTTLYTGLLSRIFSASGHFSSLSVTPAAARGPSGWPHDPAIKGWGAEAIQGGRPGGHSLPQHLRFDSLFVQDRKKSSPEESSENMIACIRADGDGGIVLWSHLSFYRCRARQQYRAGEVCLQWRGCNERYLLVLSR